MQSVLQVCGYRNLSHQVQITCMAYSGIAKAIPSATSSPEQCCPLVPTAARADDECIPHVSAPRRWIAAAGATRLPQQPFRGLPVAAPVVLLLGPVLRKCAAAGRHATGMAVCVQRPVRGQRPARPVEPPLALHVPVAFCVSGVPPGAACAGAAKAVCTFAVFIASGFFHEFLLWTNFGRATGEQMLFFVLHGAFVLLQSALFGDGTRGGGGGGTPMLRDSSASASMHASGDMASSSSSNDLSSGSSSNATAAASLPTPAAEDDGCDAAPRRRRGRAEPRQRRGRADKRRGGSSDGGGGGGGGGGGNSSGTSAPGSPVSVHRQAAADEAKPQERGRRRRGRKPQGGDVAASLAAGAVAVSGAASAHLPGPSPMSAAEDGDAGARYGTAHCCVDAGHGVPSKPPLLALLASPGARHVAQVLCFDIVLALTFVVFFAPWFRPRRQSYSTRGALLQIDGCLWRCQVVLPRFDEVRTRDLASIRAAAPVLEAKACCWQPGHRHSERPRLADMNISSTPSCVLSTIPELASLLRHKNPALQTGGVACLVSMHELANRRDAESSTLNDCRIKYKEDSNHAHTNLATPSDCNAAQPLARGVRGNSRATADPNSQIHTHRHMAIHAAAANDATPACLHSNPA
eukprot:298702-Chlamydomonas_euryale.AAC.4